MSTEAPMRHPRNLILLALLSLGLILALMLAGAAHAADPVLPDPVLTPGATLPVTLAELCQPGYTRRVRHVPPALRRQVFARYHITPVRGAYEVDHLISLELGGSNDITNLWPEAYAGPQGAHKKDALENRLHRLVCQTVIPLEQAQQEITTDWVEAYRRYVGEFDSEGSDE